MTLHFGSFAMGIDRKAAQRLERLIAGHSGVTGVTRTPPGIEGEHALCVQASSSQAAGQIFDSLSRALNAPVNAPVSLSSPGRASVFAPIASHRPAR